MHIISFLEKNIIKDGIIMIDITILKINFIEILETLLGAFIMAIAVSLFLLPNELH